MELVKFGVLATSSNSYNSHHQRECMGQTEHLHCQIQTFRHTAISRYAGSQGYFVIAQNNCLVRNIAEVSRPLHIHLLTQSPHPVFFLKPSSSLVTTHVSVLFLVSSVSLSCLHFCTSLVASNALLFSAFCQSPTPRSSLAPSLPKAGTSYFFLCLRHPAHRRY